MAIKFKFQNPTPKHFVSLPPIQEPSKEINLATNKQPLAPKGLIDTKGNPIYMDDSQYQGFLSMIEGKHTCIIGEAGKGKTTLVQAYALWYAQNRADDITMYRIKGKGEYRPGPKVAIVAFTNKASNNIRAKITIHPDIIDPWGPNITTVHNVIEYTVEFITDDEGNTKRRYYPQKGIFDKLDIDVVIVEESTTIGVGPKSLWTELYAALPKHCQVIMLGDINQLPPVIGKSVLSYALISPDFNIVELQHVYRQALDNPIIQNAHNCLRGLPLVEKTTKINGQLAGVKLFGQDLKVKLLWEQYYNQCLDILDFYEKHNEYDPMEDMILCPFSKMSNGKKKDGGAISATLIAKGIATRRANKNKSKVYEIMAGFQKVYLSVGDRVFYGKEEGIVKEIHWNTQYTGKTPQQPAIGMDYFGNKHSFTQEDMSHLDTTVETLIGSDYSSFSLAKIEKPSKEDQEEKKRYASHTVDVQLDEDTTVTCSSVGDFAELALGYALSVHKAQGSEWPRVFIAMHDTNATMLSRELLYTAITRARRLLGIMAQKHIIQKCLDNPTIKGDTLAEKVEYFNGGYLDQDIPLLPSLKQEPTTEQKEEYVSKDMNACAVRALTIVLDLPYNEVFDLLQAAGRKYQSGTSTTIIEQVILNQGKRIIKKFPTQENGSKYTPKTIHNITYRGTYLAFTSGHVLAIINGKVIDWTENRKHHIKSVWKIES